MVGKIGDVFDDLVCWVYEVIWDVFKLVIVKVYGVCFMGVLEIVFYCDFIYIIIDIKFGDIYVKFGLRLIWGMM